jgi:hypothetical protein
MSKTTDKIAIFGEIGTLLFKSLIMASVLITFQDIGFTWFSMTLTIITGIIWVLGVKNLIVLYHIFKRQRDE